MGAAGTLAEACNRQMAHAATSAAQTLLREGQVEISDGRCIIGW